MKICGAKALIIFSICSINTILSLIILILIALSEEVFFRGILLKYISDKWNIGLGILCASFIFVICHSNYSILSFIVRFVMGITYALIYFKLKNLIYPSVCHFIFNAMVLYSL